MQTTISEWAFVQVENEKNLCYWDINKQELIGSQKIKALKFNRLKLIVPEGSGNFKVLPIKGYNKTTYSVTKINGNWYCNCQWKNKYSDKDCSHIIAVKLFIINIGVEGYTNV